MCVDVDVTIKLGSSLTHFYPHMESSSAMIDQAAQAAPVVARGITTGAGGLAVLAGKHRTRHRTITTYTSGVMPSS